MASTTLVLLADDVCADGSGYADRTIDLKRNEGDQTMLAVRNYEATPYVPFVTIDSLWNVQSTLRMEVVHGEDGRFTFKNPINGMTAVFDPVSGTLRTDDHQKFIMTSADEDEVYRFMDLREQAVIKAPAAKTFDLKAYDIPYYVDDGGVYLPMTTASDILMCFEIRHVGYIDGAGYVFKGYDILTDNPVKTEYMSKNIIEMSRTAPRDPAFARFTYNELCFALDNNFGKSETSVLGAELQSDRLDSVLEKHSPTTKRIKGWLQSTDAVEYYAGIYLLMMYLDDGGHTGPFIAFRTLDVNVPGLGDAIRKVIEGEVQPKTVNRGVLGQQIIKPIRESVWGAETYREKGDTAVYSLDSFAVDKQAWEDCYDNGGDLPDDIYGNAIRALERAKANPAIKNFVFDYTCNTEGDSAAGIAVLSLMYGGYAYSRSMDSNSGEMSSIMYAVDTNLSGKFDENDLRRQYDFRYGILTTTATYSCGNLIPVLAKEKGTVIIGKRTGRGAHAIEVGSLADGFFNHLSSSVTMVDSSWKSVETGAQPDCVLADSFSDSPDYKVLYDIDKLSEIMNRSDSHGVDQTLWTAIGAVLAAVFAIALYAVISKVCR